MVEGSAGTSDGSMVGGDSKPELDGTGTSAVVGMLGVSGVVTGISGVVTGVSGVVTGASGVVTGASVDWPG